MSNSVQFPLLNYKGNEQKKMTLHLFLQVMGKTRLKLTPRKNHWWYVTEYVSTKGITTGSIPYNEGLGSQLPVKVSLQSADPRTSLLDFLESAYTAGAKKANWNIEKLKVPELHNI